MRGSILGVWLVGVCVLGCGASPRSEPEMAPPPGPSEAELEQARIERAYLLAAERRELEVLALPAMAVQGELVTDAQVQEYAVAQDAVLRAEFERTRPAFPELQVHSRHLLCETRDACEAARARIASGEDFGAVAAELSQDSSTAAIGGDLGFNPRGRMVEPYEAAVFALAIGELSAVIETRFGFHVAQVLGRRGGATTFEAARLGLARAELRAERDFAATARWMLERAGPALESGLGLDEVAAALDEQRRPVRRMQAQLRPGQAVLGVDPEVAGRLSTAADGAVIGPFALVQTPPSGGGRETEVVLVRVRVSRADTAEMTLEVASCLRAREGCESRACADCLTDELDPVDLRPSHNIPPEIMEQIIRQLQLQAQEPG